MENSFTDFLRVVNPNHIPIFGLVYSKEQLCQALDIRKDAYITMKKRGLKTCLIGGKDFVRHIDLEDFFASQARQTSNSSSEGS